MTLEAPVDRRRCPWCSWSRQGRRVVLRSYRERPVVDIYPLFYLHSLLLYFCFLFVCISVQYICGDGGSRILTFQFDVVCHTCRNNTGPS